MYGTDWTYYRTLLAVLRTGSLSAAARELGLTQPTVGRQIDALERAIGQKLFTRSQQGLLPTETAAALRPYAETLASTAAAMERLASGNRREVDGVVRISASDVIGTEILPSILASLQEKHPGLIVELSLSDTVEDLLQREADIAVRMTHPVQGTLVAQKIGNIPLGFYAHRDYLERHGAPRTPEALKHHRMIGFDRRTAFIRSIEDRLRTLAPTIPPINELCWGYRADSNIAQLAAIRAGIGIGACQIGIAKRDPDLCRVLADHFELPLQTFVVMHENLRSAPRWRVTFDAIVDGLRRYLHEVDQA